MGAARTDRVTWPLSRIVPELLINHGITTDIDTGNWMEYILAVRDANNSGKLFGPRVFTTGAGITGAGAGEDRDRMTVHNAAEAKAAAKEHVRRKVDFIKVYNGLNAEELRAICEVAHEAGLVVVGSLQTPRIRFPWRASGPLDQSLCRDPG